MIYVLAWLIFCAGMWTAYEMGKATSTKQVQELEQAILARIKEDS